MSLPENLVFLDEVSFDNRGMLRMRGYSIRGKRVLVRDEFVRKSRVSVCFINAYGLVDSYMTEGGIEAYLGRNFLDGAEIHCHERIEKA